MTLRWINDIGASIVNIDLDGNLIISGGSAGLDDARLRRAQALALENGKAIEISHEIIRQKLEAQAEVLRQIPDSGEAIYEISQIAKNLAVCESIEQLRYAEGLAARSYWAAWKPVPIEFDSRDSQKVPDHWSAFGTRHSLVSKPASRRATNPINALMNYLYAILEAEARIAAMRMGLDPGIGFLHADLPARDSLPCDLMEPVRPKVDRYVLQILKSRKFRKTDFFETREGICRLMPPIATATLSETAPLWARELGPVVENVAQMLVEVRVNHQKTRCSYDLPTPLTESNRSRGRSRFRTKIVISQNEAPIAERLLGDLPQSVCRKCGVPLSVSTGPGFCSACWCKA